MNQATILKDSLTALFRSGADEDHDADEMQELLEGIDFTALMQAICFMRETAYEYRVDGKAEKSFAYRGPSLFPDKAMLLCTDTRYGCCDAAFHERTYELWLLPNHSFAVVSCIRTAIDNDASVMEYRTICGEDWRDTEMTIDFLDLADDLDALCAAVTEHEIPIYEL